jgi:uncharacterized damage-inducible protein DinB
MSQCTRLADQIRRAFDGEAWHGDSLLQLLAGVNAQAAIARPIGHAHNIWELVLHIAAWDDAVRRRAAGQAVTLSDKQNFPPIEDKSEAAWRKALEQTRKTHDELVKAVADFPDSRLGDPVPGKTESYYDFFYMFAGIAQHEIYHAGQVAILKKALSIEHEAGL